MLEKASLLAFRSNWFPSYPFGLITGIRFIFKSYSKANQSSTLFTVTQNAKGQFVGCFQKININKIPRGDVIFMQKFTKNSENLLMLP